MKKIQLKLSSLNTITMNMSTENIKEINEANVVIEVGEMKCQFKGILKDIFETFLELTTS